MKTRSQEKLARQNKVITGLLATVLLLGVADGKSHVDKRQTDEHTAQELQQFSLKGLSQVYLDLGIKSEAVTVIKIDDSGNNPFEIANTIRAKDVGIVAQEIYSQLDGDIQTGDTVVIPNDQLQPAPRRLV